MMQRYRAFMLNLVEGQTAMSIEVLPSEELSEGEVEVSVAYSSVNFKDGLATIANRIITTYPLIPGIDLSGTVTASKHPRFREGDSVLATGYGLGVSRHGGFGERVHVPGEWIVPLPQGLDLKEAMILGTAGFTAALSVHRLEENGLSPGQGPVLVTGATGGVGSTAVDMLSGLGYEVEASTGKSDEAAYLLDLGAKRVLGREEVLAHGSKPLRSQRWAAAVDPVGGKTLESLLSSIRYGGSVALSGLTGGAEVATTVYPFIIRGINLLGIDSVQCPMALRQHIWHRLGSDLKPKRLHDRIVREVALDELPGVLEAILQGRNRGRTIVKL